MPALVNSVAKCFDTAVGPGPEAGWRYDAAEQGRTHRRTSSAGDLCRGAERGFSSRHDDRRIQGNRGRWSVDDAERPRSKVSWLRSRRDGRLSVCADPTVLHVAGARRAGQRRAASALPSTLRPAKAAANVWRYVTTTRCVRWSDSGVGRNTQAGLGFLARICRQRTNAISASTTSRKGWAFSTTFCSAKTPICRSPAATAPASAARRRRCCICSPPRWKR